ncbi:copper resistance CopC family protein [Nocardioides sp. AX2bis]|uniref:copper resistance CopC family protein n=1 Tax=Nocardioides sp. AX2bis TaxID=2653157 RepID=UPI0012EFE89D|nr:copper resistance CopC family protein [Nocardioides sp. AX2bis]VXB16518.1 conserved exported hypothetical protein [Nocardioides sp. AX2bis]
MTTTPRARLLAGVLLLAALLLGVAAPALAHSDLVGSTPRDGDAVLIGTDRLVLVFADDLLPGSEQVVVQDPAGADVVAGPASVTGETLEVRIDLTRSGRHLATYRVLSADGHAVVGELTFDVAGSGAVRSAVVPVATEPPGDGPLPPPVWWLVGAAVVSGVVLLVRQRVGRARDRPVVGQE